MAMGRKPAVDLKIIPVRVAAPTELNSSSSPPLNLPMRVSKLQYISAGDKMIKIDKFHLGSFTQGDSLYRTINGCKSSQIR